MRFKNIDTKADDLFSGIAHAEKYQSGNWIAQQLVNNFMRSILATVQQAGSIEVHEIGCGEGHILGVLATNNFKVRGCDISVESLAVARSESTKRGLDIPLQIRSIYDLNPVQDSAETVLCCEVLEHLTDPEAALKKLISIAQKDLIVSVPNEPIWHILNMTRGKYLSALGNTPGHYNHWSKKQFIQFVSKHAEIISVKTPLPWTLIHCRPHNKAST
jgi:2-polyprenyl-3-methyl-5-hydroxy-6-metoxy-1,4-benzoquinol methylase